MEPTELASYSANTEQPSAQVLPTNMASTNTDQAHTFNMSLPVLNVTDLSLPSVISSQTNHYDELLPNTESGHTNRPGADLSDQDIIDQDLTHNDLEWSNSSYPNFNDPTTRLINHQRTDICAAGRSLQYTDGGLSEDDLPEDDIAHSPVSNRSVPISALSNTGARGQYSRIQGNDHPSSI